MELIKATNINLNNGSKDILIDADFRLLEGEKYGLIGPNGVGKTTLIRLLLGDIEPDKGSLWKKPGLKVGYLPQQPLFNKNDSIELFLLNDLEPISKIMSELEMEMSSASTENMEKLLVIYQEQTELFESFGGYSALEKGENLLKQLGLDNPLDQEMGSLSGGERSLVFFAKALLSEPELLILDEPGNHLDYLGLAWLESFIQGYKGAVLTVSHNRYLLDKTTTHLLDMFKGRLGTFKGNYSGLRANKLRDVIKEQSIYEASVKKIDKLVKKIKDLQSIAMAQYNPPAAVMSQLSDAKKKLSQERARGLTKPELDGNKIVVDFGNENSKSKVAVEINNFSFGFDEKILFDKVNMKMFCGEKVALVGINGAGKSTLINRLLQKGDWSDDTLRIGPSQSVGYLSQVPKFDNNSETIVDEIRSWGELTHQDSINIAGKFAFTFMDMDKKLSILSGGEINRLQLARLIYHKFNFLILDEPTNHMDITSREIIEEAIRSYTGTVLVVSHDRYFLDQLVDRVVEIDNKKLNSFNGNFSEYFRAKYPVLPRLSGNVKSRGGERKVEIYNNFSANLIEKRIEETESEKINLEKELKAAFDNKDTAKGRKLSSRLEKLSSILDKLYRDWDSV